MLTRLFLLVSIFICCFFGPSLSIVAQPLTPKAILHKAVECAGGDTWQQPSTLVLEGDAVWTPYGRTDADHQLAFDRYAMYRVFPKDNNAAHRASGKIRFNAFYGDSTYMKLVFDGKNTSNYLSSKAKPYQKHFSWSNNFGFGIIRFADRDSFKVDRLTDDQIEGRGCYVIQITDPKGSMTHFFIDQKSYYIRSVAFNTDVGYHQRIYSDFKKAKNVNFLQPTRVRLYFDGIKWMDIQWRRFRVNEPIEETVFKE